MVSAIENVERAVPGVGLVEAVPDYVGLSDIADIVGISRQALRKQVQVHPDFPRPIHCGKPSLWHLSPVIDWLKDRRGDSVGVELEEVARVAMEMNLRVQQAQAERGRERIAAGG